jgi:hypothetical protein
VRLPTPHVVLVRFGSTTKAVHCDADGFSAISVVIEQFGKYEPTFSAVKYMMRAA